MEEKYWCGSCKKIFVAAGTKKEWIDPVYGQCMKYVAYCPQCNSVCSEYREPSPKKNSPQIPKTGCVGHCHSCEFAN